MFPYDTFDILTMAKEMSMYRRAILFFLRKCAFVRIFVWHDITDKLRL